MQSVNTFNSAGFSNLQASNIESTYSQLAHLIGSNLGLGDFAGVASKQTNTIAENGLEFTANSLGDIGIPGFNQYGQPVNLYQEDLLTGSAAPINNHSMYKLTDLLALGAALEKLDPTFTFAKLNELVKSGSKLMAAGPILLAISPKGQPNLIALADDAEWGNRNRYPCDAPYYVQFQPSDNGRQWTWPNRIDAWLHNLPTNLIIGLVPVESNGKRVSAADRERQNASATTAFTFYKSIDPNYSSQYCVRNN